VCFPLTVTPVPYPVAADRPYRAHSCAVHGTESRTHPSSRATLSASWSPPRAAPWTIPIAAPGAPTCRCTASDDARIRCRSRHSRDAVTNTQYSVTATGRCADDDRPRSAAVPQCRSAAVPAGPQVGLWGAGHPTDTVNLVTPGADLVVVDRFGAGAHRTPPGKRKCGAAGPGKWAAGCSPLPLRAPCAAAEAQGQGIRAEKFLGERSGPGRGAQEVLRPLDAECGRAKLGASSTVPPQAGPLRFLGRRGLERDPITDKT
jgi:hypothetical protein